MKKRREVVIEIGRQVVQIQVHLVFLPSTQDIRELKQQRRRRLRKRHLKSEFALPQTFSRLPYYRKLTLHEIKVLEINAT